jgi:hypothetical protein
MMIFMLKNMVALEIKMAREDVVVPAVECMVWVVHPTWAEVDDLGLVLVETWALGLVVLGVEWGMNLFYWLIVDFKTLP